MRAHSILILVILYHMYMWKVMRWLGHIFCYLHGVLFGGIFINVDNMILYFEWYVLQCEIIQLWYWYSYIIFRFEKWWGRWDTSSVTDMRYFFVEYSYMLIIWFYILRYMFRDAESFNSDIGILISYLDLKRDEVCGI